MAGIDGRVFEPEVTALVRPVSGQDGSARQVQVCAPAVGLWRGAPAPGTLVNPGDSLGELEILGVLHRVRAPAGARGIVVAGPATDGVPAARRPVSHGAPMLILDPDAAGDAPADDDGTAVHAAVSEHGLVFRSPTSGRYYSRPGPDRPAFVSAGDEIQTGATVCLLEVMKTFNRVVYGGPGLPERARITRIAPADEDDLAEGDVILQLEPAARP